jgi:hypothetical protein
VTVVGWLTRNPFPANLRVPCSGCGTATTPDRCGAPALCSGCTGLIKGSVAAQSRPDNAATAGEGR